MKKRLLLRLALAVVFFVALDSCKKESNAILDANVLLEEEKIISSDMEVDRQVPYNQVLAALENEYGNAYDFDSKAYATPPTGVITANMWVVPSFWYDDIYLTIILNGSAQIIGLYQVQFATGFSSEIDATANSYQYTVNTPTGEYNLFYGYVYTNIPNYSDRITVSNWNGVEYNYPLFNNLSSGYIVLENYQNYSNPINSSKLALKMATSFYMHYYLEL